MTAAHGTAVVFDFGRVLFEWEPEQLLSRVLPHRADAAQAAVHWVAQVFQGYGGDWGEFDRGTVTVPALVQRIATRTGLTTAEVQAVVDAVPAALAPLAGTVSILQRLKAAGHRLFYLSNMPLPYADHLERTHEFVGWFDGGVFSSRARFNKPEPAIYEHAERAFGLPAQHLLFIDDHAPNVHAARQRGWQGVQFVGPERLEADLRGLGLLNRGG
jgi:HAD superfamily hydrolase (TIGR01509 family)